MTTLTKNDFIKSFSTSDYAMLSGIYDKMMLSSNKDIVVFSDFFYSPYIWRTLENISHDVGIEIISYGVFNEADRRMVAFNGKFNGSFDYLKFPLDIIQIENKSKFRTLKHKDYLGALMSLGIKRDVLGDLICDGNKCFFSAYNKMTEYILNNINHVADCSCDISIVKNIENIPKLKFEECIISTSSMRIDNIISAIYHISRNDAAEYIKEGKVYINYLEAKEKDKLVKLNSIITVRGFGKFKIVDNIENIKSKKNKLHVNKFI